jgi:replicative DNA helicase
MPKRKTTIRKDGYPDIAFERGLPASIDAERSILGAILLDNHAYYEADVITYNDFVLDSHQRLFAAIARLMDEGHAVDIVTLAEDLHMRKETDSVGGVAYIAALTEGLPRRLSIEEYVRIVKDKSQLRRTINVCASAITQAADQSVSADEILIETNVRLLEISADSLSEPIPMATASVNELEAITVEHKNKGKDRHVISSGLETLDDRIGGGWAEGELSILAGKPGQGKSSLAIQAIVHCGRQKIPAHFFQLEMTLSHVLRRMWAAMTGIPIRFLMRNIPSLEPRDLQALKIAQEETARFPLIIDVNAYLTKEQILSRARISQRRFGTKFVAIDYLQKIRFQSAPEFRHIEVGDTSKLLAMFAKNEHVAVLALSSMTDKGGRAADSEPTLADLRQSGDIQYEASTVVLVHRERTEGQKLKRDGRLLIPKQRNGDTGDVPVFYNDRSIFEPTPEDLRQMREQREPEQQELPV